MKKIYYCIKGRTMFKDIEYLLKNQNFFIKKQIKMNNITLESGNRYHDDFIKFKHL